MLRTLTLFSLLTVAGVVCAVCALIALLQQLLADARELGYRSIRLDTVEPVMQDAVKMYRRLGFQEIPPYRTNPIEGALYMQLNL